MGRIMARKNKGYTLVEVLISMFVFGVGVMSILTFLAGSVKYMSRLNRTTAANQFSLLLTDYLEQQDITSSYLTAGSHTITDTFFATVVPDTDMQNTFLKALPGLTTLGSYYIVTDYLNRGKLVKVGKITLLWKGGKYESYFVKE